MYSVCVCVCVCLCVDGNDILQKCIIGLVSLMYCKHSCIIYQWPCYSIIIINIVIIIIIIIIVIVLC